VVSSTHSTFSTQKLTLRLGPAHNWKGYVEVCLIVRPFFALRDSQVRKVTDYKRMGGRASDYIKNQLVKRRGTTPTVVGIAPRRQIDQVPDNEMKGVRVCSDMGIMYKT
jgi:hypothetical protein